MSKLHAMSKWPFLSDRTLSNMLCTMLNPLPYMYVIQCICITICDVIWENPAYGKTSNMFLDQPFPYLYIYKLFLIVQKARKCLLQMLTCNKKSWLWSDATQNAQCLIRAYYFCSSINRVISDDVTCIFMSENGSTSLNMSLIIMENVDCF